MTENELFTYSYSPISEISDTFLKERNIRFFIKRDDLIQPEPAGNKWRKLKYNIQAIQDADVNQLLTFGGAYSNHIHAVAAAGKRFNIKTIGVIRGEAHKKLNPTLAFAESCGMHLHYVSRTAYRNKNTPAFQDELIQQFGSAYILPEGGTNALALKGCAEIVEEVKNQLEEVPDYFCAPCGTAGTISGIIQGLNNKSKALAFSALKGDFLNKEITQLLDNPSLNNWELMTDYHFGGYAKHSPELLDFIQDFYQKHQIELDPIYTGKLFYGIMDLMKKDYFPKGSKILAVHTGGLQGWAGFEERYGKFDFNAS